MRKEVHTYHGTDFKIFYDHSLNNHKCAVCFAWEDCQCLIEPDSCYIVHSTTFEVFNFNSSARRLLLKDELFVHPTSLELFSTLTRERPLILASCKDFPVL